MVGAGGCQTWQRKPIELRDMIARWQQATDAAQAAAKTTPDGLNFNGAWALAMQTDPQLRVIADTAAVADAGRTAAGRWPDPRLSAAARSAATGWQLEFALGFVLPLSGRRAAASAVAGHAALAAQHAAAAAVRGRYLQLWQAWIRWSAADQASRLVAAHVSAVRPLLTAVATAAGRGEQTLAVGALARIQLASLAQRLLAAQNAATRQRQRALVVLGSRADAATPLLPTLTVPPPPAFDAPAVARRHPSAAAALARYDAADHQLRREVARQVPDLVIGPNVERDGSQSAIGVGGGMPVAVINANRQAIAVARARRALAAAQVDAATRRLLNSAVRAQSEATMAAAQAQQASAALQPAAVTATRQLAPLVEAGELDALAAIGALEQALQARLSTLDAKAQLGLARARLWCLLRPAPGEPAVTAQSAASPQVRREVTR